MNPQRGNHSHDWLPGQHLHYMMNCPSSRWVCLFARFFPSDWKDRVSPKQSEFLKHFLHQRLHPPIGFSAKHASIPLQSSFQGSSHSSELFHGRSRGGCLCSQRHCCRSAAPEQKDGVLIMRQQGQKQHSLPSLPFYFTASFNLLNLCNILELSRSPASDCLFVMEWWHLKLFSPRLHRKSKTAT